MDTKKPLAAETKPRPLEIATEIEELEKKIAPKLATNHNETFSSVSPARSSRE